MDASWELRRYFYQTGISSIYKPHSYLLKLHQSTTVLFGMAFMNTLSAFEEFGSCYRFFGLGPDDDLRELEIFLENERKYGWKVQAIWAEFPANPILVTPNIVGLCALADEYDVVLAIDDTIGSWANIDMQSRLVKITQ
jgi:cystathionine gamma-synthase